MVYFYLNQSFLVLLSSRNFSIFQYVANRALEHVGQEGRVISVLKDIKNWTRQGPEQPDLTLLLDLT